MRPHDARIPIEEAIHGGELIREFVDGKSLEGYESDRLLASAVERQFEVMGEALLRAVRIEPELSDAVPDVRTVIGFRNVLAHGYDVVDDETVFKSAQDDLAVLLDALHEYLSRVEEA